MARAVVCVMLLAVFAALTAADTASPPPPDAPDSGTGSDQVSLEGVLSWEEVSTFKRALEVSGLAEDLADVQGTFSFLVPTNRAFRCLIRDVTKAVRAEGGNDSYVYTEDDLLSDVLQLRRVLLYHAVPLNVPTVATSRDTSGDTSDWRVDSNITLLPTALGPRIRVKEGSRDRTKLEDVSGRSATIEDGGLQLSNRDTQTAIIIDQVLIPGVFSPGFLHSVPPPSSILDLAPPPPGSEPAPPPEPRLVAVPPAPPRTLPPAPRALLPPPAPAALPTLYARLAASPDHTFMRQMVDVVSGAAELNDRFTVWRRLLEDPTLSLTVLAPTDQAFAALVSRAQSFYDAIATNGPLLNYVARAHVIVGPPVFATLSPGLVMQPLAPAPITVVVDSRGTRLTSPFTAASNVVGSGIPAANGVIHVIDNVMLPAPWTDILVAATAVAA